MKREERIQPFSSLCDFAHWDDRNCAGCGLYESESTEIENAGCRLAFALDLASVTDGMISAELVKIAGGEKELPCIV